MIGIDALIAQVDDKGLRDQLMREKSRLLKEKKFGLLFEEHIPELTPVYNSKIHKNCLVALKDQPLTDIVI